MLSTLNYIFTDYWMAKGDPRVLEYPILGSGLLPVSSIIGTYLLLVLYILPRFMKNRPAFELKSPMLIYNSFLVVINLYFFLYVIVNIDYGRRFLELEFPSRDDIRPKTLFEIQMGFLIYLSKFLDLADTIFFVLRKKTQQVTVLHVYHHSAVPILGYMAMKIAPLAPPVILFVLLNSMIHTIMYLYYALAAFGQRFQRYLWWKRYITLIQLSQFIITGIYGFLTYFVSTGYPPNLIWIGLSQPPIFFALFFNFYLTSYRKKKISKSE